MTPMHRRDFLRLTGASAAGLLLPPPLPRPRGRPVLVVIYLRGGQDALNTLVPLGDQRYQELRPTIAVPEDQAVKLGQGFGLHPALAALQPLWASRQLAAVACVGSPHQTRSHFDAQDFMEYAAPGLRTVRSGWLNRYLTLTASPKGGDSELRAVALQGLLPRALRGDYPVLAVPEARGQSRDVLDRFDALYPEAEGEGMGEGKPAPDPVVATGRATIRALRRYREVTARQRGQSRASYPSGALGDKLRQIAQLIQSGEPLEVAALDWGGFDHHANEGGAEGALARLLEPLGAALGAFAQDLGQDLERTLVLTMTEFGRTCAENGNAGTDHGHGGLMLAVGGKIAGGRILGDWPGLDERALWEGRDLRVTTDFRDVMAEVLTEHMGADLPRGFFPDYAPGKGPGLV